MVNTKQHPTATLEEAIDGCLMMLTSLVVSGSIGFEEFKHANAGMSVALSRSYKIPSGEIAELIKNKAIEKFGPLPVFN
jgi:hypothetical protein